MPERSSMPEIPTGDDQKFDAVQESASVELHESVVEPPEDTELWLAENESVGADATVTEQS